MPEEITPTGYMSDFVTRGTGYSMVLTQVQIQRRRGARKPTICVVCAAHDTQPLLGPGIIAIKHHIGPDKRKSAGTAISYECPNNPKPFLDELAKEGYLSAAIVESTMGQRARLSAVGKKPDRAPKAAH